MLLATLLAFALSEPCAPDWRFLFANGPQGEDVAGNRDALIAAVRRGSPLRVGWGEAAADGSWSVEEFSNVGFTNIMRGRDLVVQLEPAMIQNDYLDAGKATLRAEPLEWRAVMSTDGRFDAQMTDPATGKLYRTLRQRTRIHWYAFAPDPKCDAREAVNSAPPGRKNILVESIKPED
ncbi:hypothetical protein [Sphingomonas sp. UNC305MFCol5.2]|uniref:hypothetical protein n=1 Tax=Sphingomonas sp. UNC305MFCol5.2 TaxID=1449076 RepID=UPI0004A760EB|nr:hypothetical protein [Sphingomonas sp. UNC305MFCol5.2]